MDPRKLAFTRATAATLSAAALLMLAGRAHADRPLVSETADAIERGQCQLEAGFARASVKDLPSLKGQDWYFSCGLGHDSQAGVGYARASVAGFKAEQLRVVGKTSLVPPESGRTGWGISYALAADRDSTQSWRSGDYFVLGLMTQELAKGLLGHVNLGTSYSRADRQNSTVWSLGIETTSDFTLAADIFGDDRGKPSVSAGMGYLFGRGFSANLSYALLLETPRVRTVTLGAKYVF